MDSSSSDNFPGGGGGRPSPRSLQGPRPTPLKVRKDSYKIKKPPAHPGAAAAAPPPALPPAPPPQPRAPVIIYTVSPKIIHTNPTDFMSLVQRLTGPDPAAGPDPFLPSPSAAGALSPAARLASIERSVNASPRAPPASSFDDVIDGLGMGRADGPALDRSGPMPGILSPLPSSLPPISPSFFSPAAAAFDPSSMSIFQDFSSPAFHSGGSGGGNNFLISPGSHQFWSTPTITSPGWDLFNSLDF